MARSFLGSLTNAAVGLRNRTPVPYVSGRSNISIPWRQPTGAEAQMRAMGTVGTLFAIVNRTSNATALVNWRLYRKAPSGLKEDRVEVTSHAVLDLWARPNPFFTRQELVETLQQHIDLTGEGWLVIARNSRSPIPLELWPVRPDRIAPVPHPVDYISGYMYTAPDGREIALRVEDVIQIRMPNPLDPYRGMGPVQSVLTEIDASRYSAEWNRNFFMNSAEPGGIIEVPNVLSDEEFNELSARWNEQHKGVANAHRVAIIEQGKWVDRKLTQRDMQFAELRSVSRDVIREAFGAPAFILGEVGDVNRATAEASKALFAEQLTVPRLERFKGALNNDLLPLYGKDAARLLEFDYDDPVPPDAAARNAEIEAKTTAWKTLVDAGADPTLASEYLGLPDLGYRAPAPAPATAPAVVPAPAAARLDLHHHVPFTPAARHMPSYNTVIARPRPRTVRAQADDAGLEQVREQFDEALTSLLDAWEPVADAQVDDLVGQIEAAVDGGDAEALAALTVDSDAAARVLRAALGDMAETAAAQMAAEADEQGVKVKPPKLSRKLTNVFGSELVEIAAATAGLLAADIAGSAGREALRLMTPGVRGREVAAQVGGFLRGLKNWFRRDQLGGALHRAQNIGRLATLAAAPPARYVASERNDSSVCPPCHEIDGTEFEDLAAAQAVYGAGGYLQCEGGIRCRGTVAARWDTTTEASMGRTRRAWNTASPEQIAARGRAMRPAVAAPDGAENWYRITNAMDPGTGNPCLYIYGDIGSWGITAAQCVQELSEIDAPVIDVYISSPGGEVFEGLAVYSALRAHPAKIMVRIDSLAASIASVIAMAGDRVVISPGGQVMIHDANTAICGDPAELRKCADFLDAQSDNIAAIYQERAGGTVKQWRSRMVDETWYFADEAVAAGLADEVAKPARQDTTAEAAAMAAAWDLSVYNYAHTSRDDAPAPDLTNAACPTHHTATVDSPWDGSVQEKRLPSPMTVATAKKAYGWYDSAQVSGGKIVKAGCKLPHHEVGGDGSPGAANLAGVRNALARLPQSDIPEAQRAAVEAHLRAHLADGGGSEDHADAEPIATFDPATFRAAAQAALDPMPDYQPDHLRSLMAGLAGDAPAAPAPQRIEAPYVPPPADTVPETDPEQVAVGWFRSLFTAVANDAPAAPPPAAPAPTAEAPQTVYVPEPPPPADEVAVDYMRTLMANAANDLAAPDQAAAPDPAPAEPVPAIDRTQFERSLKEARL